MCFSENFCCLAEQDLNGMIDAAKYADLVLLLVDGAFGFEMETFEFLNILQVHPIAELVPLNPPPPRYAVLHLSVSNASSQGASNR
jgi:hypothetical protein